MSSSLPLFPLEITAPMLRIWGRHGILLAEYGGFEQGFEQGFRTHAVDLIASVACKPETIREVHIMCPHPVRRASFYQRHQAHHEAQSVARPSFLAVTQLQPRPGAECTQDADPRHVKSQSQHQHQCTWTLLAVCMLDVFTPSVNES